MDYPNFQQSHDEETIKTSSSPPSTNNLAQCSFTFVDANGLPLSKEQKSFLSSLRVVYATTRIVANSADVEQQSSKKHLLLFSEVRALTPPNRLGKVQLITVNTSPNQLLMSHNSLGQEQVVKLSSPSASKSMDAFSDSVQRLLAQESTPIQVKDENEEYVDIVPVIQERSIGGDVIFKASAGQFQTATTDTTKNEVVGPNSYQLVCHKNDKVMCQKFVPFPQTTLSLGHIPPLPPPPEYAYEPDDEMSSSSSLFTSNNLEQIERGVDENENPCTMNPISLVLLAAHNLEYENKQRNTNNNLMLLAEAASERLLHYV